MRKTNLAILGEHSVKETSDVAFWRVLLVGVNKRHVEIVLRIEGAFQ